MPTKITRQIFDQVKSDSFYRSPAEISSNMGISISTVYRINGSPTYDDYIDKVRMSNAGANREKVTLRSPFDEPSNRVTDGDPKTLVTPVKRAYAPRTVVPDLNDEQVDKACELLEKGYSISEILPRISATQHQFKIKGLNSNEYGARLRMAQEAGKAKMHLRRAQKIAASKRAKKQNNRTMNRAEELEYIARKAKAERKAAERAKAKLEPEYPPMLVERKEEARKKEEPKADAPSAEVRDRAFSRAAASVAAAIGMIGFALAALLIAIAVKILLG